MKRFLIAAAVFAAASTPALAADVGLSISIGQPGFYGRLDLGDFPEPQVIDTRPIIIERGVPMDRPPVYLRVPSKHRKHWKRYCRRYNACGDRVIFVQDDWYNREYVPRYQEKHRGGHDGGHDAGRREDRGGHGKERHDQGHDRDRR